MTRSQSKQKAAEPEADAEDKASKDALARALLETVRLALEEKVEAPQEQEQEEDEPEVDEDEDEETAELEELELGENEDEDEGFTPRRKVTENRTGVPGGPCAHCNATESPQWRRPLTKNIVLCNACGIYYSRHNSLPKRKKVPGGVPPPVPRPKPNYVITIRPGNAVPQQPATKPAPPPLKEPSPPPSPPSPPPPPPPEIFCEEELDSKDEDMEDAQLAPSECVSDTEPRSSGDMQTKTSGLTTSKATSHPRASAPVIPGVSLPPINTSAKGGSLPGPASAPSLWTPHSPFASHDSAKKHRAEDSGPNTADSDRPRKRPSPSLTLPLQAKIPIAGGLTAIVDNFLKHKVTPSIPPMSHTSSLGSAIGNSFAQPSSSSVISSIPSALSMATRSLSAAPFTAPASLPNPAPLIPPIPLFGPFPTLPQLSGLTNYASNLLQYPGHASTLPGSTLGVPTGLFNNNNTGLAQGITCTLPPAAGIVQPAGSSSQQASNSANTNVLPAVGNALASVGTGSQASHNNVLVAPATFPAPQVPGGSNFQASGLLPWPGMPALHSGPGTIKSELMPQHLQASGIPLPGSGLSLLQGAVVNQTPASSNAAALATTVSNTQSNSMTIPSIAIARQEPFSHPMPQANKQSTGITLPQSTVPATVANNVSGMRVLPAGSSTVTTPSAPAAAVAQAGATALPSAAPVASHALPQALVPNRPRAAVPDASGIPQGTASSLQGSQHTELPSNSSGGLVAPGAQHTATGRSAQGSTASTLSSSILTASGPGSVLQQNAPPAGVTSSLQPNPGSQPSTTILAGTHPQEPNAPVASFPSVVPGVLARTHSNAAAAPHIVLPVSIPFPVHFPHMLAQTGSQTGSPAVSMPLLPPSSALPPAANSSTSLQFTTPSSSMPLLPPNMHLPLHTAFPTLPPLSSMPPLPMHSSMPLSLPTSLPLPTAQHSVPARNPSSGANAAAGVPSVAVPQGPATALPSIPAAISVPHPQYATTPMLAAAK